MQEHPPIQTYNGDETFWRDIDRELPPALRANPKSLPQESLWMWRSHAIHLDRLEPEAAKCHFIVVHGAGGNGRMMLPLVQGLAAAGHSVVAPDLPPFGLSRLAPGHVLRYSDWIELLVDLVREEIESFGRPVILFGTSVGGLLAYNAAAAADCPIAGLAATTLADPRNPAVRRQFASYPLLLRGLPLVRRLGSVMDRLAVPISLLSRMHLISNDERLARLIASNPHAAGTLVPLSLIRTMIDSAPVIEPADFHRCPILLVHPEKDLMTPLSLSLPFFERLAAPKRLVLLEGSGHFPIEEPGCTQLQVSMEEFALFCGKFKA